jgi:hypothetical protein
MSNVGPKTEEKWKKFIDVSEMLHASIILRTYGKWGYHYRSPHRKVDGF